MILNKNQIKVVENSYKDEGEGVVSFPNGLTISDNQVQRNGTTYDIDSLDVTRYNGQLTADHDDKLASIIGRVEGLEKKDGRLYVNKIVYAVKQNPLARLAYDLLLGGFSNAFSTETIGSPASQENGLLKNHELVGLSQVVCPNNYSAIANTVHNSLSKAKEDGLDVTEVEKLFNNFKETTTVSDLAKEVLENKAKKKEEVEDEEVKDEEVQDEKVEDTEEEIVVTEDGEVKLSEEETEEDDTKDEEDEDEKKRDRKKTSNEITDSEVDELFERIDRLTRLVEDMEDAKDEDEDEVVIEDFNEVETDNKETNQMDKELVANAVAEALKGYFAESAKAPEFTKQENSVSSDLEDMDWKERYNKQVNSAYEALRLHDINASKTLTEINQINLNKLKEAGIAKNSMTIASMGNFVIPPEMYREIVGKRTDYSALIDATDWRETDSLEFAWLKRNGDIDMKNVAMCDDGKNGNLKPISEYSAEPVTGKMEEMAAVTVVCNAATRFFAVDLLADVAGGYRNDYDRKRAQLVVAELQKAVNESGQLVDYAPTSDTEAMISWLEAISEISDASTNGTLIFNNKSFSNLKAHALQAGVNGPLSQIFTDGKIPQIFGTPIIVVPNDLMPTIESNDKISFTVNGETVDITTAVFYADLSEFVGYTSGGLQYDISSDASYEVAGATRSAYQRNELVLRGSFFRGGAVKDTSRVAGISQGTAKD